VGARKELAMSTRTREPSAARDHSWMKRVVGATTVAFWTSAALWAVLVALFAVAPSFLLEERFFLTLSGASLGLAMVSSGFLFWQELRASRQELRAIRRKNHAIRVEDDREWTPRAWLYGTACALFFFVSWFLLPAIFLS
jgi:hypothetical protein